MSAHQKPGPEPSSAMIWRLLVFLNPPWHLHLQCRTLVVHWLQASGALNLIPKWGHSCYFPLGGNVELVNGRSATRKDSYQEGGNTASDVAKKQSHCQGLWWITMQHHNADNSTTFLCRFSVVTSHKNQTYAYAGPDTHCKSNEMLLHAYFSRTDSSLTISLSPTHS